VDDWLAEDTGLTEDIGLAENIGLVEDASSDTEPMIQGRTLRSSAKKTEGDISAPISCDRETSIGLTFQITRQSKLDYHCVSLKVWKNST
jgi:hypothetical protein